MWVLLLLAVVAVVAAGLLFFVRLERSPERGSTELEASPLDARPAAPPLPAAETTQAAQDERRDVHEPAVPQPGLSILRFDAVVPRGTRSAVLAEHAEEWRAAMRDVGTRLSDEGVVAVVFAHGSFVGTDPLSALGTVERALPNGRELANKLRRHTRSYVDRMLGDLGNFGPAYVRLFEEAIGKSIPCTSFVWSSENHHVGRLEGALGLVRVLATHAELGAPRGRILVLGHSHAGQVFALVTQLLSRSLAGEAIVDVARARALDVSALDVDIATLEHSPLDFVTFGAPARYAWAELEAVRSLHVVHDDDWVRRLGGAGSDFPALASGDRKLNATLDEALGRGFAPSEVLRSLRGESKVSPHGEMVLVDYGAKGLAGILSSGLGHGSYTRLDAMLFHASLVASRLYPVRARAG
ncbi:MAG: hypothetical protein JWP87_2547 [Labilithrix sp.]|nr:hypothetical protein [Labilithrix sp.]